MSDYKVIVAKDLEDLIPVFLKNRHKELDALRSDGVSFMPDGIEKNIPLQDMSDLISFIKNWRYLDGSVPREVIR